MENTLQIVINALVGPGGGLLVSVGVLYWLATRLYPEVRKFFRDLTEQMERITKSLDRIEASLQQMKASLPNHVAERPVLSRGKAPTN